ncbi:sulfatase-like hydrolase/transferase [Bythopirellula polymerisocia]|uniref:Arylsulfatase n=1 Tax=Bythopirellula polymerisocia TaxID=2528003 RepID=A0A5C6CDJ8_9BACT|nr:sulfatase-like hydrolase/transferase [Bythopirellula polymerisocia]TWU21827.1 Arylsulfatase [Bythopirellula polymerisocia]
MSQIFSRLLCTSLILLCSVRCSADNPNIVVILVDDMGYGDPGCFNPESKILTPHIDSIARAGMRFTDAHAPGPLCHMSRYGLMTGRYPFRTDVSPWPEQPLIEPGQLTVASLAKREGYDTAMVGKWHLGFQENGYDEPLPGGPTDCGFDSFFGIRASTDIPPYFYIRGNRAVSPPTDKIAAHHSPGWNSNQGEFWRAGGIAPDLQLDEVLPRFTDEAIQVIQEHASNDGNKPLMLYLAYPAPHTPWLSSEEYVGKSTAGAYGDFVMMVDAQIGRVLTALDEADITDDTLLVFTSDNGPCWYDVDTERLGHDATGQFRGMKSDAWEGGHRMPLIVRWPGRVKSDTISDQLVCFTDFLATFASVMGVQLPEGAGPDSFDFLTALTGQSADDTSVRNQFVMRAGSQPSMMTIRSGDWKLITQLGSGGFSKPKLIEAVAGGPSGQLYNLADDPGETTNLYLQHPDIVARLTAEMKTIVDDEHSSVASQEADRSTLTGKVMCGYQGWFNCEGDGAQLGWKHWARNRKQLFAPGNVTVDLWPDLSEFDPDELYDTGFTNTDGSIAKVFSSNNRKTVLRHFRWMQDYGIDGVFLQRFANGLKDKVVLHNYDTVLGHVRQGAGQAGRSFAIMYDLSGLKAGELKNVRDDWRRLRSDTRLAEDPAYQQHDGMPVVAIWGVGFGSKTKSRDYSLAECRELIECFKEDGCTVILGVPTGWRKLERDAIPDPQLLEVLELADVLSPWTVGRYRNEAEVAKHMQKYWRPDQRWCDQHELSYMPVVFPGFSWHNLHGGDLDSIPRQKGKFLWSQAIGAKQAGCEMLYVAMFDEVDEGTAIFKCTNQPPTGNGGKFLTYEGLPSDFYLRLVGKAGEMLRGEIPRTKAVP